MVLSIIRGPVAALGAAGKGGRPGCRDREPEGSATSNRSTGHSARRQRRQLGHRADGQHHAHADDQQAGGDLQGGTHLAGTISTVTDDAV